jgi:predicted AAA+ superfamily ATPase
MDKNMMDKRLLKEVALEQWQEYQGLDTGTPRQALSVVDSYRKLPHAIVISGMRRAGKSTLLTQIAGKYKPQGHYYFNFEDERLLDFKVTDFNVLYEVLIELFGEHKIFFLDEIQNVDKWEVFVRRMMDKKYKFFITGSNASLLSKELGSRLTGRSVVTELYPFSFREFLAFKKFTLGANYLSLTTQRAKIKRHFQQYLREGGVPEYHKYGDPVILKTIYENILYRDIVARHDIKDVKALRELSLYYLTNIGRPFSYNKLKGYLKLGSENTVKSYTGYLEDSYLMFELPRFDYSLKRQFMAPKKIYCMDNGIVSAVAFQFSKNRGQYLENTVFVELKRRGGELFYYHTKDGKEVDFAVKKGIRRVSLLQVTESLFDSKVREREISALTKAMQELKLKKALILTEDEKETLKVKEGTIDVKPVYEWLLEEE